MQQNNWDFEQVFLALSRNYAILNCGKEFAFPLNKFKEMIMAAILTQTVKIQGFGERLFLTMAEWETLETIKREAKFNELRRVAKLMGLKQGKAVEMIAQI